MEPFNLELESSSPTGISKANDFDIPQTGGQSPSDMSSSVTSPQSVLTNAALSSPPQTTIELSPNNVRLAISPDGSLAPSIPPIHKLRTSVSPKAPTVTKQDVEQIDFSPPQEFLDLTATDIQNMTGEESRLKLLEASTLLRRAANSADKYRKLTSQLKLQNQLLLIEMHEASQRSEVEKVLIQREVDRLTYEQIDHQNSMSATIGIRIDSEAYRRRLQRTKLKLRDAMKEIESRDKTLVTIRKLLRDGRLERESLEAALKRQRESKDNESALQSSPPAGNYVESLRESEPTTPRKANTSQSGLDTLGFVAFKALNTPGNDQGSSRMRTVPPVSADFPQFSPNRAGGVSLPPLRFDRPGTPPSQPETALLSPVAFKDAPPTRDSASNRLSSPPILGSAFHPINHDTLRRDSSASTISVQSEGNAGRIPSSPPARQITAEPTRLDLFRGSRSNQDESHDSHKSKFMTNLQFPESPRSPQKAAARRGYTSGNISKGRTARPNSFPGVGSSARIMVSIFRENSSSASPPSPPPPSQ